MSERLHLALIMSRAPKLYVLDEPLAGVDPLARDYLLELIRTLRSPEAPLLLSTHLINGVDSIFNEICADIRRATTNPRQRRQPAHAW